jgi:AraC-like DNA-binding protein/quercetin dioxygenase-like cupin family protein
MQNLEATMAHLAVHPYREAFVRSQAAGPLRDPFLVVFASRMEEGKASRWHDHAEVQISYVRSGRVNVYFENQVQLVEAGNAICIPSGARHQVQARHATEVVSAYIAPRVWDSGPGAAGHCFAAPVAGVLLEKCLGRGSVQGLEEAVLTLLRDEARTASPGNTRVAMPRDTRLAAICRALLRAPQNWKHKAQVASIGNVSERTMSRLFRSELGMTYTEWVQQVLVRQAVERLHAGDPVTTVAFDLGYSSHSAFSAMFRRQTGLCPTAWNAGVAAP